MKLTDEYIERIAEILEESQITIETLKADLLDHLSCVVEIEMKHGKNFETSLNEALKEVAPNGLQAIQQETILLLNAQKIIRMKKIMYAIGFISTVSISLGWLFLVLNWAGGRQLFNSGFLAFLLLFLPLLAIDRYKVNLRKAMSEKLRIVLGFSSAFIIGIAIGFKYLHLQGADILLIAGMLMFTFGFLPFLFFNMYKKSIS